MNHDNIYDLAVVGGGPAGLTAALYMGRARYKTLVIEKEDLGGQITITNEVVNYPAVKFTTGSHLMEEMNHQAKAFGAEIIQGEVVAYQLDQDIKTLELKDGRRFQALTVLIATGANPRHIGFKGEEEFRGRGVAYCATCDGEFFTDMDIFVVGGGFAAAEEGLFLTRYGKKVTYILNTDDFTCAKSISDEVKAHPKIDIHYNTEVVEVGGEVKLSYAIFRDTQTGNTWRYDAPENSSFGLFVFAGYVPNTRLFQGVVSLDDAGYIITSPEQATNRSGVFAAGDVCIKPLRQLVTAVSDGAIAATSAEKEAARLHKTLNLPSFEVPATRIDHGEMAAKDHEPKKIESSDGFLPPEMKEQVAQVMDKFENHVILRVLADNSVLGENLKGFANEIKGISDKVSVEIQEKPENLELSTMCVLRADGSDSGISFTGVPGGHEFNSFVLGLYNVAGPGQAWKEEELTLLEKCQHAHHLKVVVSLSCTMCPDVVQASQRLASKKENIQAEMIDMQYAPELRKKYNIMSVPCLIIDDKQVMFGKKNLNQILEALC